MNGILTGNQVLEGAEKELPGIDRPKLTAFLRDNLAEPLAGPLQLAIISGGKSNPTYQMTDGVHRWILRRQPLGHVLPSAHDMGREYRVINALGCTAVPVPEAVVLCESSNILGGNFYVMDEVSGRGIKTPDDAQQLSEVERRQLSMAFVEVFAQLHSIEPAGIGLESFGRPHGYMARQLKRWSQQWEASKTTERPQVDKLAELLSAQLPVAKHEGIVHGDVKLDNILVSWEDPTSVVAVLDWEMSTLGDTFADLGIMLSFWDEIGQPTNPITNGMTALPGFLSRAEMIDHYCATRGITASSVDWYVAFADFKIAIILEGILNRDLNGHTVGGGFDGIADMIEPLLDRALKLAETTKQSPPR